MHQVIFKGIQGSTLPSGKVRILFLRTYDYIYRNQSIKCQFDHWQESVQTDCELSKQRNQYPATPAFCRQATT